MRLENVLALTNGTLVNEPFVSSFTNIVFEIKAVKHGDLFIAFSEDTIQEAIQNGAYGIIFSKPTQISDSEIAWIKVQSALDALKRLLRFRLIEKNLHVYETNAIVLKLALQVITEPKFIVIDGSLQNTSKLLWDAPEGSVVLFCQTYTNKDIFTKIIELSTTSLQPINIIEQTLFETSFIYNDIFYERQQLSPFFIPYLEILLTLFKNLKIKYRLKKFTPIEHFEAVFTNKNFEIKEFGTSDKVLIFEKQSSLVEAEILFLQREATWGKIVYLMPYHEERLIQSVKDKNALLLYKNENEITKLLKNSSFHFALIIGVNKDILTKPIHSQAQISLFDFNEHKKNVL